MCSKKHAAKLKILRKFLTQQISENFLNELSDVLSRMCIYTFSGGVPAVISIWHDWKECWQMHTNPHEEIDNEQIVAQGFMAAFNFLNEVFWTKNNDVTIKFVMDAVDECLAEIAQNNENILWSLWKQYLKNEEGLRYRFAESIILPIIVERKIEGANHYFFIEEALSLMSHQDIQKGQFQAFDAEGKTVSIEIKYKKLQAFFLIRWLLFTFNALTFSLNRKKYYFEVFLPRTYENKQAYLECSLSEYLKKYGLMTSMTSLSALISLFKEIN